MLNAAAGFDLLGPLIEVAGRSGVQARSVVIQRAAEPERSPAVGVT
jgi:hypothetical protein